MFPWGESGKAEENLVKLFLPGGERGVKLRSRSSPEHVAMAVAAVWLVVCGVVDVQPNLLLISLFSVAPLIVATVADERRVAIFAGAAAALAIAAGWWDPRGDGSYWPAVVTVWIISAMAVVIAGTRRRRQERLARMTAIAEASQLALLPPLPAQMAGISIAARYHSATCDASVGGDLYEIIPSGSGIRVIIGDVCGKGLDAILLAGQVLSAFRRSAVAMPALEQVAGEVGRAIRPHLGQEGFVTATLAQIAPSGDLTMVNCGHHPPLLRHRGDLRPVTDGQPGLPLGLEDHFSAFTAAWSPSDRLLFYTDGLVESRNARGDFLSADEIATALAAPHCDRALDTLMTAVHRHTGGRIHDDIALLLLEHCASAPQQRQRTPARHPCAFAP
jgi:phosphoserine phosphatase RsbU/P